MKFTIIVLSLLFASSNQASNDMNGGRQFPEPQQPFKRIDNPQIPVDEMNPIEVIGETSMENSETQTETAPTKEEEGFLDSYFGEGAQTRVVGSINNWIVDKAKTNPGCVERFVCETYKTGETLDGVPYFLMTLTNAAVSFMVAEMFDKSVNLQEITRAARYGRTMGTCHTMQCEFMDNQLRTVGDYLGTFEDFVSSIFNSISNSINIGK